MPRIEHPEVSRSSQLGDRFWFWDASHFPHPVTPAAETLDLPAMARGFAAAAAELRRPLAGQHVLVVEGFVYFGIDIPSSPERLRELEAAYQQQIAPRIDRALHTWTSQYLPEAERINRELWECARAGGSGGALAAMLDRAVDLRAQQWRIHDLALVPAMAAAARFTERYADQIGGPLRAQLLLQGFPNRATEAAEAL